MVEGVKAVEEVVVAGFVAGTVSLCVKEEEEVAK